MPGKSSRTYPELVRLPLILAKKGERPGPCAYRCDPSTPPQFACFFKNMFSDGFYSSPALSTAKDTPSSKPVVSSARYWGYRGRRCFNFGDCGKTPEPLAPVMSESTLEANDSFKE